MKKKIILVGLAIVLMGALSIPALTVSGKADAWSLSKPVISCDAQSLEFTIMKGDLKEYTQTINIWNSGGRILWWMAKDNASWLKLKPTLGSSSGSADEVEVSVNAKDFELGVYEATITIYSWQWGVKSVDVHVTLNVIKARPFGPVLCGFPTPDLNEPLIVKPDGGILNYVGLTAYLVNGPDVYHCPIFDLLEVKLTGSWEMELEYGSGPQTGTYTEDGIVHQYEYYPITGGSLTAVKGDLKQYWSIETVGEWQGVHYPEGRPTDGEIVGGKIIYWPSTGLPGGGTNNWMITLHVETGGVDANGADPGDFTHKIWLVDELRVWIEGVAYHMTEMNFDPSLWEKSEDGTLMDLITHLPVLKDLCGRFLGLNDEEISITVGPLMDAMRPLMPEMPGILPTLLPIFEDMITAIIPNAPTILISMPNFTPCPIMEYTFGWPEYRY